MPYLCLPTLPRTIGPITLPPISERSVVFRPLHAEPDVKLVNDFGRPDEEDSFHAFGPIEDGMAGF